MWLRKVRSCLSSSYHYKRQKQQSQDISQRTSKQNKFQFHQYIRHQNTLIEVVCYIKSPINLHHFLPVFLSIVYRCFSLINFPHSLQISFVSLFLQAVCYDVDIIIVQMIEQRYFSSGNEPRYKIIMIGDPYVGKTTLFWKYIEGQYLAERTSSVTTIDFKIKQVRIDGVAIKLFIWDTAGQQKYRAIVSTYFNGCQGVMLLFDLTKPQSFISATTKWFDIAKAKAPDAVFLLVGNKSDLEQRVDEREVQEWARSNRVRYMRTSVKNDVNVNECYRVLSQAIYRKPPFEKTKSFTLKNRDVKLEKAKDKKCC